MASWICTRSRRTKSRSWSPQYVDEAAGRGIFELRIVHGKGTGALKRLVHAVLAAARAGGRLPARRRARGRLGRDAGAAASAATGAADGAVSHPPRPRHRRRRAARRRSSAVARRDGGRRSTSAARSRKQKVRLGAHRHEPAGARGRDGRAGGRRRSASTAGSTSRRHAARRQLEAPGARGARRRTTAAASRWRSSGTSRPSATTCRSCCIKRGCRCPRAPWCGSTGTTRRRRPSWSGRSRPSASIRRRRSDIVDGMTRIHQCRRAEAHAARRRAAVRAARARAPPSRPRATSTCATCASRWRSTSPPPPSTACAR